MEGIYCYVDLKDNSIVYVGKDSNIDKKSRYYGHKSPTQYHNQTFNRILQNNLSRYKYKVLKKGSFRQDLLNALEILYIRRYNPKFNFSIGGEGITGYRHSEETKQKMSENKKKNTWNYKPYYRVCKLDNRNGVQRYVIKKDGKSIKASTNPLFLSEWFEENYPNEKLENRFEDLGWVETNDFVVRPKGHMNGKKRYCIRKDGKVYFQTTNVNNLFKYMENNYSNSKLDITYLEEENIL